MRGEEQPATSTGGGAGREGYPAVSPAAGPARTSARYTDGMTAPSSADAFFLPDGSTFVATPLTRGPWDVRFQHGGPPSALLTEALSTHDNPDGDFVLARLWIELLRPVPIAPLTIQVHTERAGRTVQRLSAVLCHGDTQLAVAQGLRILRAPVAAPVLAEPAWTDPDALDDYTFTFFDHEVGYHQAVQLRYAAGTWPAPRVSVWGRPRVPLVAGRPTGAHARVVIVADAQSGMCPPVSPTTHTFVNPDLTLYFLRAPAPDGWLGFDIRSEAGPDGAGLAESRLRDAAGVFGRSAQSMVVTPR